MADLFASGRIVDVILVLVALEALLLIGWRIARGRGPSVATLVSNLASGAALMLAVRAALIHAHWTVVAAFLLASLVAHLTDMGLRFRASESGAFGRAGSRTPPGTSMQTAAFSARPSLE